MLTFINSVFLVVLSAAVIPLLIHLFNRQRTKKISFSSLRFLKIMEKKRLKKVKLLQWLLILIRTLIIIFLVLSFARPILRSDITIPLGNTEKTVVIVLDTGINMFAYDKNGMHFQRAKRKLKEILGICNKNDEIYIINSVTGENIKPDRIDNVSCKYTATIWPDVYSRCTEILKNTARIHKQVFIISDFLFNALIQNNFDEIPVYYCLIGNQEINNFSVDTVMIKNSLLETGKPIVFEVTVSNRNKTSGDNIDIHLYIDDNRAAHQQIQINAGSSETIPLSFIPKEEKIYQGYIEISDDDLLVDNRFYFSFEIQSEIRMLLLENSSSLYLKAALEAITYKSNINAAYENFTTWKRQNLYDFQIILLDDPGTLDMKLIEKLDDFTNRGSIIVLPGAKTKIEGFNNYFKNVFPGVRLENLNDVSRSTQFFTFKSSQFDQPLFEGIYRARYHSQDLPHFFKYYHLNAAHSVEKLLVFNNEDPYLIKDNGNFLFTAYIDESWSDIQFKGIFSPLLVRLFQIAAVKASPIHKQTVPEHAVNITLKDDTGQNKYSIQYPDGHLQNLLPLIHNEQKIIHLNTLKDPGHYTVYNNQKPVTVINVNCDRKSIQPPFTALKNSGYQRIISEDIVIQKDILTSKAGVEFTLYTLIIVLILLATEHIIVKYIEGDGTA